MLSRLVSIARRKPILQSATLLRRHHSNAKEEPDNNDISQLYGSLVFNDSVMKQRLPSGIYNQMQECIKEGKPLDSQVAEVVATSMREWAIEKGATHFTHWFQPLTGLTAEKHDSFIKPQTSGNVITSFSGKSLIQGEPDASSFPSGGLRPTHAARGYTVWDPKTPAWVMTLADVPTLNIPTCFVSWKGHALDRKIPLLRSDVALETQALNLFRAMEDNRHTHIFTDSGVEQEFFLVNKEYYNQRPDLMTAGRTLIGSRPAKNQELSDSYFGPLPTRVWRCINEIERSLWRLGVPVTTRHREVAPNQFEIAPVFSRSSIASDTNMLMMDVLKRVANKFDLAALLHEKPFAGVNGSGKHNNWSIGTSQTPTVFKPGKKPAENNVFLVFLAATIRAVDTYPELLRYSIASAGNDHRLGANEAPPAIMSVYLGEDLQATIDEILTGKRTQQVSDSIYDEVGVPYLPKFKRDTSDRNRTSPFAFTGNKFEVRAVGSSQRPSASNFVLNTILADSCRVLAKEIDQEKAGGKSIDDAIRHVVKTNLEKHQRVIFNGDNYSSDWIKEAEKRGLPNLKTTPDVIQAVWGQKFIKLFESLNVLSKEEWRAQLNVDIETYSKTLHLEGRCLLSLANKYVVPAAVKYYEALEKVPGAGSRKEKVNELISDAIEQQEALLEALDKLETKLDDKVSPEDLTVCFFARDEVVPLGDKLRKTCDSLEEIVDRKLWPLPSYEQFFFEAE